MPAFPRSLHIRPHSATSLRRCWRWLRFRSLPRGSEVDRLLVWAFNVEGAVDLIAAIILATVYGASPFMGPTYWIPAFWVPALLVTHCITFVVLQRYWTNRTTPLLHATATGPCMG